MLRNPFQIAIVFAIVALVVKLALFYMGIQHHETPYVTFIYMLLSLIAVFFGIRSEKINNPGVPTSFMKDLQAGARTAAFFAILVGGITYVYYSKIDANFFPTKMEGMITEYKKIVPELVKKEGLEATRKDINGTIKGYLSVYSPFAQTSFTFLGLVFLGLINSIIFALLMKKFPGFKQ